MKRLNCAIYTRKSSDEGLEKEFNSLDAQREACAAYVLSQKHAGWAALPDLYDDGGLSGGTMERPALQRLLADITSGKVQIVVVYKVDRLTRSLADFAKIVDVLDAHGASFVSVTQQFNTTTSMGRLTLNMLLSFAQFEREIAGERIRDKIAASKAKGMWMGGNVPLGYDVKERKLIVNDAEAETVRMIFRRYAELGSVRILADELAGLGIVSKRRRRCRRRPGGWQPFFPRRALHLAAESDLPGRDWASGQGLPWSARGDRRGRALATRPREAGRQSTGPSAWRDCGRAEPACRADRGRRRTPHDADACGEEGPALPVLRLDGADNRQARSLHEKGLRVPAGDVEALVLDRIRAFFASEQDVGETLSSFDLDAATLRSSLSKAVELSRQLGGSAVDQDSRTRPVDCRARVCPC